MKIAAILAVAGLALATPAVAEPIDRWWSGAGMGDVEYGYSGSDGSRIYFGCSDRGQFLHVSIRGMDPRPNSTITFNVDGEDIEFRTAHERRVEMNSHVSLVSLYYLFDQIRAGDKLTLRFDGVSKEFSLMGSARSLGREMCS